MDVVVVCEEEEGAWVRSQRRSGDTGVAVEEVQ